MFDGGETREEATLKCAVPAEAVIKLAVTRRRPKIAVSSRLPQLLLGTKHLLTISVLTFEAIAEKFKARLPAILAPEQFHVSKELVVEILVHEARVVKWWQTDVDVKSTRVVNVLWVVVAQPRSRLRRGGNRRGSDFAYISGHRRRENDRTVVLQVQIRPVPTTFKLKSDRRNPVFWYAHIKIVRQ